MAVHLLLKMLLEDSRQALTRIVIILNMCRYLKYLVSTLNICRNLQYLRI